MIKKIFKYLGLFFLAIILGLFLSNVFFTIKYKPAEDDPFPAATSLNELAFLEKVNDQLAANYWPGFNNNDILWIIFNDRFEFLVGEFHIRPEGWTPLPSQSVSYNKPVYFREANNPQAYAVRVDSTWAASLGTLRQMNRSMYFGIKGELPPVLNQLMPFFLIKLNEDVHVSSMIHERFHAYEALMNESKFIATEGAYHFLKEYPYDNELFTSYWQEEGKHLSNALAASNKELVSAYADSFLLARDNRRAESTLQASHIEAEKSLEWLEGIAKYTEYESYKLALKMDNTPYKFKEKNAYWQLEQTQQLKKLGKQGGDQRFYHSGCAMAMILDKLHPAWKSEIMKDGVYLEDLLREKI